MLGIGGRFVSGKGMVVVPDLSNLSPQQAGEILVQYGLKQGPVSSQDTSNSGLSQKVFQQSVAAGQLVDYESEVFFTYYNYVAPQTPPDYLGDWEQTLISSSTTCNGLNTVLTEIYENRKYYYTYTGQKTSSYIVGPEGQYAVYPYSAAGQPVDGACGCCPPTCDSSKWTAVSSYVADCNSSNQIVTTTRYRNDCYPTIADKLVKTTKACCYKAGTCGTFSDWVAVYSGVYQRSRTCYRQSSTGGCVSYTDTETKCVTSCGSWRDTSPCIGRIKYQSRTCVKVDCSTYSESRSVSC